MREILKVGLAVRRPSFVLLVRKYNSDTYILPGGKPEGGEDDFATLRREIHEELGCSIVAGSLAYLGVFADEAADHQDTRVVVRLYAGELEGNPRPQSEIQEIIWYRTKDATSPKLAPSLRNSILPYLARSEAAS